MAEIKKIPLRSEIPVEDTWAVEDLYPTDEAWEQDLVTIREEGMKLTSYMGRLGESGQTMYDYFIQSEVLEEKASRLGNYCMRCSDADTRNCPGGMPFLPELQTG